MNIPYKSVACSFYDTLETLAMRRATAVLTVDNERVSVVLVNLFTRDGAEFLETRDATSGDRREYRLDLIMELFDPATNRHYRTTGECTIGDSTKDLRERNESP